MKRKKFITIGIITLIAVVLCIGIFVLLQWRASLNITRSQVRYDNEDIIYIPDEGTLAFDEEECIIYYNNLLSVYLLSDLSDKELKALADRVDGKIVGDISGCINYVQIKVSDSSFEELNRKADILNQLEEVLYASYDAPMFMQPSAADNNPWSDNTSAPESDRGNEANPNGNDWWAEAIGAYTAWEYVDSHVDELKPVKVGVIDDGFFTEHEDLSGKIEILNGRNITNDVDGNPSAHGTAVSGIIAANNDDKGIRGVADHASLLCADYDFFDEEGKKVSLLSTGQYIEITKQMIEKGCKVINCSFGVPMPSVGGHEHDIIGDIIQDKTRLHSESIVDLLRLFTYADPDLAEMEYSTWISYRNAYSKVSATQCMSMLMELLLNKDDYYEDFLIVQAAGNGYDDNGTVGYDTVYTGFYAGITEDLYNRVLGDRVAELKDKLGISYSAVDEHILIVGASKNKDTSGTYRMSNWSCYGDQVDICAPGERISSLDIAENMVSEYSFPDAQNISLVEPFGTSFSAPMVSGGAALLWSIDPSLGAADVRKLLLESGTKAVGVGEDAGTEYPIPNIGESIKKLTGWSNAANILEGLYIEPDTQNILYVEQDEDQITFTAFGINLIALRDIDAELNGNQAYFFFENERNQVEGTITFEDSTAILSFTNQDTLSGKYVWLRESAWELSDEQLKEIGQALGVPANLKVEYTQGEARYWDVGERYLTYVTILLDDEPIASANVDTFTGELVKEIWTYSPTQYKQVDNGNFLEIHDNDQLTISGILTDRSYEINSNNKGTVCILKLDTPANVILYSPSIGYNGNQEHLTEIQINFHQNVNADIYLNQKVTVQGTVIFGHTGHHLTAVVLMNAEITESNNESREEWLGGNSLIGNWICDEGSISFSENGTCYVKMNGSTITEGGKYSIVDENTLIIDEPGKIPYEVNFQFKNNKLILGDIAFTKGQ